MNEIIIGVLLVGILAILVKQYEINKSHQKLVLEELQKQNVYLSYLFKLTGVPGGELTDDRMMRFHHALETALMCVGASDDQVERILDDQAETWRFIRKDT